MASKISRGQVAAYVASELESGRTGAVQAAAAWLADTGRARQAGYLARDVAAALAERGYVAVTVTTARALEPAARAEIEAYIKQATGAKQLELDAEVDPELIGGAIIATPTGELDSTVKTKLSQFVQDVTGASV